MPMKLLPDAQAAELAAVPLDLPLVVQLPALLQHRDPIAVVPLTMAVAVASSSCLCFLVAAVDYLGCC